MDENADFKVSLPGNDAGLHGVPVLLEDFFNIPGAEEGRLFAPFLRDVTVAFVAEYGWNFAYRRSCSLKI